MTLKERIEQEAIKYSEFNKFGSDRRFEFNRDKVAFTNGAYFYFDKIADEFAIGFAEWCIKKRIDFFDSTEIGETYTIDGNVSKYKMNELLEIFKKEKGL